jgi:hypothetical protein
MRIIVVAARAAEASSLPMVFLWLDAIATKAADTTSLPLVFL